MPNFVFTHVTGKYVFDESLALKKVVEASSNFDDSKLDAIALPKEKIKEIMHHFRKSEFFKQIRQQNIEITRKAIKESVNQDQMIIQAINSIEDMTRIANSLAKRLREWYELNLPEISHNIEDHEGFVKAITSTNRIDLLRQLKLNESQTLGAELGKKDMDAIMLLAKEVKSIYAAKLALSKYLDELLEHYCPNMLEIAGTNISAKLLSQAGSLKKLAGMPSSTIQLLGAEKAFFRHVKTGARGPKHGLIVQHEIFTKIKAKQYGKAARILADKISIAARVDYFKGKFIGKKLRSELDSKIGEMI